MASRLLPCKPRAAKALADYKKSLALGGSGDALAGFLAGLLAQPALQADVEKTIRYAVWQHGAAADELQAKRANWVVEDLVTELGNAR